jgi:SagB-type dehydrogenase family enzyme
MMANQDIQAAWQYHNGTKHPNGDLLNPRHRYDPADRLPLFKLYPEVAPIPLPLDRSPRGVPALAAIARTVPSTGSEQRPNLDAVARLLFFSSGITKQFRTPWGTIPFRAAACTGALYHIELYLVCGDLPGLAAGVYHMDPREIALRRLRQGDYRQVVIAASGDAPQVAQAPAILIATDVIGRNAVKYQARAYRHTFWDSGTMLANTLAIATTDDLPAQVVLGFVDWSLVRLLDLDPRRELAVALIPIGAGSAAPPAPEPLIQPLGLATEATPDYTIDFPAIRAMHQASVLPDAGAVAAWRAAAPELRLPEPTARLIPLQPLSAAELPTDPTETVIVRRGSARRFVRAAISFQQLSTTLHQALQGVPLDVLAPHGGLNDVYLIVNAVDGLERGAYVLHRDRQALELLKAGNFRAIAGHLALDQELAADASVDILFLADLPALLGRLGNRGYRAAQLEAGIAAGRLYLAAYAQGLAATGLTFYDDAITDFFSPHAAGKSVLFLLALGKRA